MQGLHGRGFMSGSAESPNSAGNNVANQGAQPQASGSASSSDPLCKSYRNSNWAPNQITEDTVMDYFCDKANPFYDAISVNEQCRMQQMDARQTAEIMQTAPGLQYHLMTASPPLFVIAKIMRYSANESAPVCYYYICNGTVYQCPDLNTLIQSRLCASVDGLNKAFMCAFDKVRFNPSCGYSWDFKKKDGEEGAKADADDRMEANDDDAFSEDGRRAEEDEEEVGKPGEIHGTTFQNERTNRLMAILFEKFPAPADGNIEIRPQGEPEAGDEQE
uniref:Mediator of RNA polymerase II transcription subunit 6 n=1 Tax=Steinernema glaseri TaxID=37863 RepID=A0A1I7ZTQ4_9BILA